MFLRCYNRVEITQTPTPKYTDRGKRITLDFLNSYEVNSTWDSQTDTAKVIIPKNVVAKDMQGHDVPLAGTNLNIGGGDNPLFFRGDKIAIYAGYWYKDELGNDRQYVKLLFQGFITKVFSKLTITLECEDYMFLLKQIPAPDQMWPKTGKSIKLQDMLKQCLNTTKTADAAGIAVKTQADTELSFDNGTFYTKSETVAQVLARMQRDLFISSYMKGTELRVGRPTYWPEDVQNPKQPYIFDFQKNIISDSLQYVRRDDIILSAVATSSLVEETTTTLNDGQKQTRKKKIMVYVYADVATQKLMSKVVTDSSQIPTNTQGERYDFQFNAKTTDELIALATNELEKRYYTGFRGSFTTFGMPWIPYGDNVKLVDKLLPDRNGVYKVKAVKYTGGIGIGIRQEIELDYKVADE